MACREKKGAREETGNERSTEKSGKNSRKDWKKIENWKSYYEKERTWKKKARKEIEIDIRPYDEKGIEKKRQEKRREQEREILMYSDGSKTKEYVAAGICRIGNDGGVLRKIGYRLGKKMEIMDAEMVGIKKAIEVGLKEAAKERKKTITIRCDSQEAMRRVKRRHQTSGEMMAHKIRYWYDAGKTQKIRIRLEWVKGHSKIKGNLEADKAAKEAINKGRVDNEWFVSFAFLERESREETIREWEVEWEPRANKEKVVFKPSQRNTIKFDDTDRTDRVIISRLRTGHIAINRYLKRIGKIESAECECGKGEQSVTHILTECDSTAETRKTFKEHNTVVKHLWKANGIEAAIKIWKQFVKWRWERNGQNENGEEERRELGYGWGTLKDAGNEE